MSFQDIALPLAARGIPVIPVQPWDKRCLLTEWPKKGSRRKGDLHRPQASSLHLVGVQAGVPYQYSTFPVRALIGSWGLKLTLSPYRPSFDVTGQLFRLSRA
jgi:hypothetical protein